MKAEILKLSKCKDEASFYRKYPSESAFMKVHGKAFKKLQLGETIKKAQGGYNISNQWRATNPINTGTVNSYDLSAQWSKTLPQADGGMKMLPRIESPNLYNQPIDQNNLMPMQSIQGTPSGGTGSGLGNLGGSMPYLQAGTDIVQGLSMLKGEKNKVNQAKQSSKVSQVQLDAARTRDIDANRMNRQLQVRPEDMQIQPNQLFPTYGVGTNVLQGKNGLQIGGEIQNTYAPNTLYDDGGYEPLNDSNIVKRYQDGGFMSAMTSTSGQNLLGNLSNRIVNDGQGPNAGSEIGGGVGSAAGMLIGGPLGAEVGKIGGQLIGGLIDSSGRKIKNYNRQTDQNIFMANQAQMDRSNSYMKEGGWMNPDYNPQLITKFGDIDVTDLHNIAHEGMDTLRTGGHIRQNYMYPQDEFAMGGELQVYKGEAEPISQNKYLPEGGETVMFRGPSHADGGMPIQFGKEGVEVEGGEPAVKLQDGGSAGNSPLVVFGNLPIHKSMIPLLGDEDAKGKKFKNYVNDLSKKEEKMNKILNTSTEKVNDLSVGTSISKLELNSYQANILGANMHLKELAEKKKNAGLLQQAINDTAEENGWVADNLAKGEIKKAKFGGKFTAQDGKKFKTIGINPGSIDYNPIAPDYNKDYWNSAENYKKNWIPKVESAFANPEQAKSIISQIENYSGQDNADVKTALAKGNNLSEKIAIAKRLGTDQKIGPYHQLLSEILSPTNNPGMANPPLFNIEDQPIDAQFAPITDDAIKQKQKFPWMDAINGIIPYARPNYQLDRPDLSPEMMAMGFNNQEPVQARTVQPQLSSPYDISYQDILNKNQGDFRAMSRMSQNNPAFLSQLASQKYGANQQVLGEQFRANQAEKDKVYGENRNLLNQSQLQNLQILDQQYQRQDAAKSKTKEEAINIAKSISDKMAKYKEEQMISNLEQNRYNYRFDNNGRAINMNQLAQWNMAGNMSTPSSTHGELAPGLEDYYDLYGRRIGTKAIPKEQQLKNGKKLSARNGAIVKALKNIK